MEQFIKNWVKEIIDFQTEPTALKKCGYNCATSSGMIDEIENKLKSTPYEGQTLSDLEDYIRNHVFHEHHVSLEKDTIHLSYAFDGCVCPVMNHHAIQNEKACSCTAGFIQHCFETVSPQSYNIEIVDSFIKNNKPCSFKITVE